MVKQKVVIKISVNDEKGRHRALKAAVGVQGCLSAAIEGAEKNMMVVIGDNMDSVVLAKSLRKKVGGVDLISVGPVTSEKKVGGAELITVAPGTSEKKVGGAELIPAALFSGVTSEKKVGGAELITAAAPGTSEKKVGVQS